MVVLAVDIDIGVPAEDYTSYWTDGTLVNMSNPANASGKITKVDINPRNTGMTGVSVGTFYRPDPGGFPNNLTTRDYEYCGDIPASLMVSFDVELDVEEGDFIGVYFTNGDIEKKVGGEDGIWYVNHADYLSCDNYTFSYQAGNGIGLYGIGVTIGWTHKWNTQTISKWNGQEFTKWNGLE